MTITHKYKKIETHKLTIEDQLLGLTADLVEEEEVFIERLFSHNQGEWIDISLLCKDLYKVEDALEKLEQVVKDKIRVTWLNYPASLYGSGYCLIIFFIEMRHWHNVAVYNKQHFDLAGQNKL